jgi:hypothetical protein
MRPCQENFSGRIGIGHAVAIGAAAIHRAIELADRVAQQAISQTAAHLAAKVAVRQQVGGQCRLDEARELLELQALEADRRLELAESKQQRGTRAAARGHRQQ